MNLTPIDVEQKAFTQALRGYQMDEVDDFLDEVVGTLRNYEQRLREAHDKVRVLETEAAPANRGGDESEISRAILTAQRSADRLLIDARAEADEIKAKAIAETSELVARRDAERDRLQGEISSMTDLVNSLRSKLRALTTAVDTQIDQMDTEIANANVGLGSRNDESLAEEQLLDDFDAIAGDDQDQGEETAEETAPPSFSDIFPDPEVDLTQVKTRVTSRPWERG